MALRKGVAMKVVSAFLGHSTTSFTMGTYMHVCEGDLHAPPIPWAKTSPRHGSGHYSVSRV